MNPRVVGIFSSPFGFLPGAIMQITFFTEHAAQAAVRIWEQHGFSAVRLGTVVVSDCPTLWAVPIIRRAIGFHQVERLDVMSSNVALFQPASETLNEEDASPSHQEQLRCDAGRDRPSSPAGANSARSGHRGLGAIPAHRALGTGRRLARIAGRASCRQPACDCAGPESRNLCEEQS